jgi:hypothetical protein
MPDCAQHFACLLVQVSSLWGEPRRLFHCSGGCNQISLSRLDLSK